MDVAQHALAELSPSLTVDFIEATWVLVQDVPVREFLLHPPGDANVPLRAVQCGLCGFTEDGGAYQWRDP